MGVETNTTMKIRTGMSQHSHNAPLIPVRSVTFVERYLCGVDALGR